MAAASTQSKVYRTIWRWHFYAGLFVLPFIMTLAFSGSFYLFKPQIERWEEREFRGFSTTGSVAPRQQVEAAVGAFPGATFFDYRLPQNAGDAAMVRIAVAGGAGIREVFVAPDGAVLGALVPDDRVMAFIKRIHSELLIGKVGNLLVELAASWAIALILSGLFLWWPRGRGMAGTFWPRLTRGSRIFWRDLHAVTGIWISGFALVLLLSGLPWAGVWGPTFQAVRAEMGWIKGSPTWAVDSQPQATAGHDHGGDAAHHVVNVAPFSLDALDAMVTRAESEQLAFPALVTAPGAPGRFGMPGEMVWTLRSDAQNTPMQQTIRFDLEGQRELSRERFQDGHIIDRVVGYGIAWHEGQLFGWINQLIGVLTAMGLVTLAITGFILWRRRKPVGRLGAPSVGTATSTTAAATILLVLALFLPLLAGSLVLIWLMEQLALPRLPKLAHWLGVSGTHLARPEGES